MPLIMTWILTGTAGPMGLTQLTRPKPGPAAGTATSRVAHACHTQPAAGPTLPARGPHKAQLKNASTLLAQQVSWSSDPLSSESFHI